MSYYTTEITSDEIVSDNVIHQRLLFPYIKCQELVSGNLLEVGCGFGRGVETLKAYCEHYTGIDKLENLIQGLQKKHPDATFKAMNIPPFHGIADNSFDTVVTFQVIEHINKDGEFLKEIKRVLKPGGKMILTTPQKEFTLSRNPWHVREYDPAEMKTIVSKYFDKVDFKGVAGNEKVMAYHEENRKSVQKIMKWDIFNLQYNLPAWILRKPYDYLNRKNRQKLLTQDNKAVQEITFEDFYLSDSPKESLDHFVIAYK